MQSELYQLDKHFICPVAMDNSSCHDNKELLHVKKLIERKEGNKNKNKNSIFFFFFKWGKTMWKE